jgi:hypothetical protein
MPLILKYLSHDHPFIFDSVCDISIQFTQSFSNNIVQYIDSVLKILIPRNIFRSNLVLQVFFLNSPRAYSKIQLQYFLTQIQVSEPNVRDSVFETICCSIDNQVEMKE